MRARAIGERFFPALQRTIEWIPQGVTGINIYILKRDTRSFDEINARGKIIYYY